MPCVLTMVHLKAGMEKEQTGEPARESAYVTGTLAAAGLAFNASAAAGSMHLMLVHLPNCFTIGWELPNCYTYTP